MKKFIPDCYQDPILYKAIDELIEDGFESFDELTLADQKKLTSIALDLLDTDAYSLMIEDDLWNMAVGHFKKYAKTGRREYAMDFAETVLANAVNNSKYIFDDLFQERLGEYKHNARVSAGLALIGRIYNHEAYGEI